jgi:hypothetical protein
MPSYDPEFIQTMREALDDFTRAIENPAQSPNWRGSFLQPWGNSDATREAEMTKTRLLKHYEDITASEILSEDDRTFTVRVATNPRAQRQFDDLSAADSYLDELVFKRLNRTVAATAGAAAP